MIARPSIVDRVLAHTLADADRACALIAGLGREPGACLDDDGLAALVEFEATPAEIAHVLSCPRCARAVDDIEDVLRVEPIPSRTERPPLAEVALAAALRTDGDSIEVLRCTGTTRVQGALATRSGRGLAGVSLRDRAEQPRLELALLASHRPGRWTLMVRWLAGAVDGLVVRASRDGRLLAEDRLVGDTAVLDDLRRGDLRVDVHVDRVPLATAWLEVQS